MPPELRAVLPSARCLLQTNTSDVHLDGSRDVTGLIGGTRDTYSQEHSWTMT